MAESMIPLEPLTLDEIQRIRDQSATIDWSAEICQTATINDFDPDAIVFAREKYKEKHQELADEVNAWDDTEFLNSAEEFDQRAYYQYCNNTPWKTDNQRIFYLLQLLI